MAIKIGINGFGRIGRAVARIIMQRQGELELAAATMGDTTAGKFKLSLPRAIVAGLQPDRLLHGLRRDHRP